MSDKTNDTATQPPSPMLGDYERQGFSEQVMSMINDMLNLRTQLVSARAAIVALNTDLDTMKKRNAELEKELAALKASTPANAVAEETPADALQPPPPKNDDRRRQPRH